MTIVTSAFVPLARSTMESLGFADMAFVEVAHPLGMIPLPEIHARAEQSLTAILKTAAEWKPAAKDRQDSGVPAYPAERITFKGTYGELNDMFYERGWSLGLPIIPPTSAAVAAMLKGAARKPDEVVWVVPPRMGRLTMELVATIGVMAGCKPAHMPLLLAIVKALSHPDYDWLGSATTTGATAPVIIINGPILDEMGIGYSTGVLGGHQPVNIALGYFVNLLGDIVGGSVPPDVDKSAHGSRGDLVALVLGENESANPWRQSYAVEQGYNPTDSVVTAFSAYPGTNNTDHSSTTGRQLLNTISVGAAAVACGITTCLTRYEDPFSVTNMVKYVFLLLGPEHADTIFREFPTKRAVKEYVVKKAALPHWGYAPQLCEPPESFGPRTPDTMIPRFSRPECIHIVVTGGPGKQSQIWAPFPTCSRPVSIPVTD